MRIAMLWWAAVLVAQARDIPFDGNVVKIDRLSEYTVGDHRVELKHGALTVHLADSGAPTVEIVTPSIRIEAFFVGDYRVEVTRFGNTVVKPDGGEVRVTAPAGAQWVSPGQKMIARGPADNPEFRIVTAVSRWRRRLAQIAGAMHGIDIAAGGAPDESSRPQHQTPGGHSAPAADSGKHNPTPASHEGATHSSQPSAPSRGK
jgi:hypothetical protein